MFFPTTPRPQPTMPIGQVAVRLGVAQLEERSVRGGEAAGSSPATKTRKAAASTMGETTNGVNAIAKRVIDRTNGAFI
jgi:hypothetical protein